MVVWFFDILSRKIYNLHKHGSLFTDYVAENVHVLVCLWAAQMWPRAEKMAE